MKQAAIFQGPEVPLMSVNRLDSDLLARIRSVMSQNPFASFIILHFNETGYLGATIIQDGMTRLRILGLHSVIQDALVKQTTHICIADIRSRREVRADTIPDADIQWIRTSLQWIGITLIDYVLISEGKYYSFVADRRLNLPTISSHLPSSKLPTS